MPARLCGWPVVWHYSRSDSGTWLVWMRLHEQVGLDGGQWKLTQGASTRKTGQVPTGTQGLSHDVWGLSVLSYLNKTLYISVIHNNILYSRLLLSLSSCLYNKNSHYIGFMQAISHARPWVMLFFPLAEERCLSWCSAYEAMIVPATPVDGKLRNLINEFQ